MWNPATFVDLVPRLANELDMPFLGTVTGYSKNEDVVSLYKYFL